jgi:hypothetical protein
MTGIMAAVVVAASQGARAGIKLKDIYGSVLGGYDSNADRNSEATPGAGVIGDVRFLLYGGAGLEVTAPGGYQINFRAKPYYIKYQDFEEWDRGEMFLLYDARKRIGRKLVLIASDKYRYTTYPNRRGRDQLYNSFRFKMESSFSTRIKLGALYRNLYRSKPRSILRESRANGLGVTARYSPSGALTANLILRRDYESVEFIFPRSIGGRRTWMDLSLRYHFRRNLILMGKYVYQRDEMDILFFPGSDLEEERESGEEVTDGILQSIRFLEDTAYNFRKNLVIGSIVAKKDGAFLDVFGLFQRRHFAEKVLEVPGTPQRVDDTLVFQASIQTELTPWSSFMFYVRYEDSESNDPDHDYRITTYGLGTKFSF